MQPQKKALVLGGTGTIGHQLVKRLKREGFWVRCVDRKLNEYSETQADEMILGDLREEGFVSNVMFSPTQSAEDDVENSFDEVYMLAAEMGGALYVFSKKNDAEIITNSLLMNIYVARHASLKKVKKTLFSSSACCYGEDIQKKTFDCSLRESDAWHSGKPDSVYGIEKLASEEIYDSYRRNHGLNVRICRFHNVFSEEGCWNNGREKYPASICRKVAQAPEGGFVEVWGDGEQMRSYLHVSEALEGVRRLMDSDCYEPINIGSDHMISCNDLARMVIDISGKNITIKNVPSDCLGVRGRNCNNELIDATLGWHPTMSLYKGMKLLYGWVSQQVEKQKLNWE
jgi:GDP-D-mannose 3',5'-epimerase